MKNKAISQIQEYASITLSVITNYATHTDRHNIFQCSFWLALKVDTGSGVGQGKSQEVTVEIEASSLNQASLVANAIQEQATKKVQAMELTEALVAFPVIIADLVVVE